MMRLRLSFIVSVVCIGAAIGSSHAAADFEPLVIKSVDAGESTAAAGAHPDFTTEFEFVHEVTSTGYPELSTHLEDASVSLPPGLVGNPQAIPMCSTGAFLLGNCPVDSQIGVVDSLLGFPYGEITQPLYNLEPAVPGKEIARFGFTPIYPVFIDVSVRTAGDYGVTAKVENAPSEAKVVAATTTIWGNPADPVHDPKRLTPVEGVRCTSGPTKGTACEAPGGKRPSGLSPTVFLTNPSSCQEQKVSFLFSSYQLPGQSYSADAPMEPIESCQGLPFGPVFDAEPTSRVAGAPTGLHTRLLLPQHDGIAERATATMREARVTLPEGMQIAAGAANWIDVCSDAEVGYHEEVVAECPKASELGAATIVSPALPEPLSGTLYQRTPIPGRQFGFWLVSDALGLHIKLPGQLEPDQQTGRLTAVFKDLPQVPVEEIELNVRGGARAPLQNPPSCGTYRTDFAFAPHSSDPAVSGQSEMKIDQRCDAGFHPRLSAGVTEPAAGQFSPLILDLIREDGEQALRGFELHLPQGELAKLAGVPLCSDGAAASGACPGEARIGSLTVSVGPGPDPLWLPQPGKSTPGIFLAGPYQGAPYSIVTEVPAQAGPFDLGTVTSRSALSVNPETVRATVKADPLPQFFEGVAVTYRRLHVVIDRPQFSLNPTDCREMATNADVSSTAGASVQLTDRFQVDGCRALKFKPKLSLGLGGGSDRGEYPSLTAVLKARKGNANISRASVSLPHSEFLAQEHIQTVCTRKQFAANKCPKKSIYGRAKAWTSLLSKPLAGKVYLRSSEHLLPDLVVALRGQIAVDLVARIDSYRGGIRTTFGSVPDAPVTKFLLKMEGGAKGLLTNSSDICRGHHRAVVAMRAQNGRVLNSRPLLENSGCKRGKHPKSRRGNNQ